jgi:hypothetical protein
MSGSSRIVRASKFRHVFAEPARQDATYQDLELSPVTGDHNVSRATRKAGWTRSCMGSEWLPARGKGVCLRAACLLDGDPPPCRGSFGASACGPRAPTHVDRRQNAPPPWALPGDDGDARDWLGPLWQHIPHAAYAWRALSAAMAHFGAPDEHSSHRRRTPRRKPAREPWERHSTIRACKRTGSSPSRVHMR